MAVSMSMEIDAAALASLQKLLGKVEREMPGELGKTVRRIGVELCRSLAARTRKAPKRIPRAEYIVERSPEYPTITNPRNPGRYGHHHGKSSGLTLHRYRLTRKLGTPDQNTHDYFVYAYLRHTRRGKIVSDKAREVRELLQQHGNIQRAGLAKLSWRWASGKIAGGGAGGDISYQMRKYEKRDPRRAVDAVFRTVASAHGGAKQSSAELTIENALDYIVAALRENGLSEATTAAVKSMMHKLENGIEKVVH